MWMPPTSYLVPIFFQGIYGHCICYQIQRWQHLLCMIFYRVMQQFTKKNLNGVFSQIASNNIRIMNNSAGGGPSLQLLSPPQSTIMSYEKKKHFFRGFVIIKSFISFISELTFWWFKSIKIINFRIYKLSIEIIVRSQSSQILKNG